VREGKAVANSTNLQNLIAMGLIGAAAGWLSGISLSPTANTVVAAVTALGGAVVAALSGLNKEAEGDVGKLSVYRGKIDPLPVAVFAVALAIVANIGIVVRESEWLAFLRPSAEKSSKIAELRAAEIKAEVEMWVGLGAKRQDVLEALMPSHVLAKAPSKAESEKKSDVRGTGLAEVEKKSDKVGVGLYGVDVDRCKQISGVPANQVKGLMTAFSGDVFDRIAKIDMPSDKLQEIGVELCKMQ
jgi:hypothetical protein